MQKSKKNKNPLYTAAKEMLDIACKNNSEFVFESKGNIFNTYDDSSGQRKCRIEYYGYGRPNKKSYPTVYKIKRVLAFCNKSDEGKDGAVIGIFHLDKVKDIQIRQNQLILGNYKFTFFDDIVVQFVRIK